MVLSKYYFFNDSHLLASTWWNDKIVKKMTWFHFHSMKTGFLFFCCRASTSWPVVYKSQERKEPSIMSGRATMFNKRDRRCAAVQLMLSADPSYDNSTFKMQIWIATNKRDMPRVMKTKFPTTVMVFGVVSSKGHIMPPHIFEVGLKVNTKVYLDVLKSVVIPRCVNNKRDADNNPKTLNDKKHQASSKKFRQIIYSYQVILFYTGNPRNTVVKAHRVVLWLES